MTTQELLNKLSSYNLDFYDGFSAGAHSSCAILQSTNKEPYNHLVFNFFDDELTVQFYGKQHTCSNEVFYGKMQDFQLKTIAPYISAIVQNSKKG